MFNNDNPKMNGELRFINEIKNDVSIVFDVGSRVDSLFTELTCEVHYFDPNAESIDILSQQPNNNIKSFFNKFGLSNSNSILEYFPLYQSFIDRSKTYHKLGLGVSSETKTFQLKKAKDYLKEHNIKHIDLLKIDTEGFELNVVKGFEDKLKVVKVIQFEYGGTFSDAGVTLKEMIDYLKIKGFNNFCYLDKDDNVPITDFTDHHKYCNIICYNKYSICN